MSGDETFKSGGCHFAVPYEHKSIMLSISRRVTSWQLARRLSTPSQKLTPQPPPRASRQTLLVSEIFSSVQGEGPHTGRPSVFLRLGVCNLSCAWCDTPYTWLFTADRHQKVISRAGPSAQPHFFNRAEELTRRSVDDVFDEVVSAAGSGIRAIVVTGGEPLLHVKPLLTFLPPLLDRGFNVEFETNGTVSPAGLPGSVHLNISPKLANSMQPRNSRIRLDVLQECLQYPSSILKFVVGEESDVEEVIQLVDEVGVTTNRVYLMPLGRVCSVFPRFLFPRTWCSPLRRLTCFLLFFQMYHSSLSQDSRSLRQTGRWLTEVCQRHGFNYSHRVHVELWGDQRGV